MPVDRRHTDQGTASEVESLRGLGIGWLDDESPALSSEGLSWLSSLLVRLLARFELPAPHLYPTPDGHVRAEWSAPRWDFYAEFDITKHAVHVLAGRVDSDEVHERDLALGALGAEAQLGQLIATYVE